MFDLDPYNFDLDPWNFDIDPWIFDLDPWIFNLDPWTFNLDAKEDKIYFMMIIYPHRPKSKRSQKSKIWT